MNERLSQRQAVARVRLYHEATKHHPRAYAPGPGFLDWDSQPDPFRRWPEAPVVELPLVGGHGRQSYDGLYAGGTDAHPLSERSLGLLLELALGLSAWKRYGGDRWALRNNPSSGNLHPTEGYILLWRKASERLPPGLYHYDRYEHALERRATLSEAVVGRLEVTCPRAFAAIGFTSIVWREAWKYGSRACRYCQLDAGHALACARFAAAVLGWSLRLDSRIGDARIASLLGLDRAPDFADAEPEQPEMLAVLSAGAGHCIDWGAVDSGLRDWRGRASRTSNERVDWPQVDQVSPALIKAEGGAPAPDVDRSGLDRRPVSTVPRTETIDAADLIRSRRSAQRMDGVTGLEVNDFVRAFARTLPDSECPPFDAFPSIAAVDLILFVHAVEGVDPGLYLLLRNPAHMHSLRAATASRRFDWVRSVALGLPLYRLRAPLDVRKIASQLSCHQGIAGRGAFAVAMLADMGRILDQEGAWAWRRLHWEAGMIGQVLYLEAEAAGLRGTGIGCFFDDEVHRLLGLEPTALHHWQVVYHFTVGGPVEDPRLVSEPAYTHLIERGRVHGVAL